MGRRTAALRALVQAGLAGLLLGAAFPPGRLWPLAWVLPAGYLATLRRGSPRAVAGRGAAFGAGLYLTGMGWLFGTTLPGALALGLYFALFYGVTALPLSRLVRLPAAVRPVAVAAGWVAQEFLLAHLFSGIPWLLLGYTQGPWSTLLQAAALGGVYAVSFLCAWANGLLLLWPPRGAVLLLTQALGWAGALAGALLYGRAALRTPPPPAGPEVALVQPGIPQRLKDNPLAAEELLRRNHRLTLAAVGREPPDLLVWAETMNPFPLGDGSDPRFEATRRFYAARVREEYRTWFLLGTLYYREDPASGRYWNSAVLWDPEGHIRGRYDKLHPIPWAEYVPGKIRFLEDLLARYTGFPLRMLAGRSAAVLHCGEARWPFGALICYDMIHPGTARRMVQAGARFLVHLSNEAWFGKSREFDQLLTISRFRAIENRVPIVRATNSGISAHVDAWGRVRARLVVDGRDRAVAGWLRVRVHPGPGHSLYGRWGDWLAWGAAGAALVALLWGRRRPGQA